MKYRLSALMLLGMLSIGMAYDISTFVSQDSAFLKEGERIEQPTAQITHNNQKYWVVPVIQNEAVATFLPLYANVEQVESSTSANRRLFQTADILRSYLLNKQNIVTTPGSDFFITASNNRVVGNLSRFLADEIFEMNIIQVQVNDNSVERDIDDLKGQLVGMSEASAVLSGRMEDALDAENLFVQSPDTNSADAMKDAFDSVFVQLFALEEEALEYRSDVDRLKQSISLSSLDSVEKNNLINLASPPAEFELIGNWVQNASGLQQITDSIYSNASIRTDSYLAEFAVRVKRNNAYQVLYGLDDTFRERTGDRFTSIAQAANEILSRDNKPLWENQEGVELLSDNWGEAVRMYDREEYEAAEQFAQRAKDNAIRVLQDGVKRQEPPALFSPDLIIQIVGVLVVLLAGLYVLQNREKLLQAVSPSGMEREEIETRPKWDKEF